MWFYSAVFFCIITLLSTGYFFRFQKISYCIAIISLIVIAAFRPQECCRDYINYIGYYNSIEEIPLTFLEPTYYLFAKISEILFDGPIGIFIAYAILGVGLKGIAFYKLTKYYSLSLIIYFGSFFLLHEMTQIRVGVSSAILLLSIPSIVDKNFRTFFLYMILGFCFHYSFIIFGLFYFLNTTKLNPWLYIGMIIFAFGAYIVGLNLVSFFQIIRLGFISDKINAYKSLMEEGMYNDIQLINPLLFLRIAIMTFLLMNWQFLQEKNRYSVVLIKLYSFSIFFFIALADLPALAGRLNQLFGIVELIVIPSITYIFAPKYFAVIIALIFAVLILYKQLYYSDLMMGYF
jgi:hypothetical protein